MAMHHRCKCTEIDSKKNNDDASSMQMKCLERENRQLKMAPRQLNARERDVLMELNGAHNPWMD